MSRLTIPASVLPLAGALLLVLIIKAQFDDPGWPKMEGDEAPATDASSSVVKPEAPAASCQATEDALRERIDQARACSTNSDCTLFDFGYPIECMTSVAKSEITALRLEFSDYEQHCEFRVYYDCPTEPMRRRAVCEQNRCTVRLQGTDALEEQTREYLRKGETGR